MNILAVVSGELRNVEAPLLASPCQGLPARREIFEIGASLLQFAALLRCTAGSSVVAEQLPLSARDRQHATLCGVAIERNHENMGSGSQ